jgi:hypothetical protein
MSRALRRGPAQLGHHGGYDVADRTSGGEPAEMNISAHLQSLDSHLFDIWNTRKVTEIVLEDI